MKVKSGSRTFVECPKLCTTSMRMKRVGQVTGTCSSEKCFGWKKCGADANFQGPSSFCAWKKTTSLAQCEKYRSLCSFTALILYSADTSKMTFAGKGLRRCWKTSSPERASAGGAASPSPSKSDSGEKMQRMCSASSSTRAVVCAIVTLEGGMWRCTCVEMRRRPRFSRASVTRRCSSCRMCVLVLLEPPLPMDTADAPPTDALPTESSSPSSPNFTRRLR
mmetsp:Transcript_37894/g.118757  ORF Transcript_37894/g.118757 Transcript_37894/m.118757 type:complete len:221 (+) Transcript_37894:4484-5146(+)